jgi:hypothetical protein
MRSTAGGGLHSYAAGFHSKRDDIVSAATDGRTPPRGFIAPAPSPGNFQHAYYTRQMRSGSRVVHSAPCSGYRPLSAS